MFFPGKQKTRRSCSWVLGSIDFFVVACRNNEHDLDVVQKKSLHQNLTKIGFSNLKFNQNIFHRTVFDRNFFQQNFSSVL